MKEDFPKRRTTRLKHFDYSTTGAYFITICTKDRRHLLSDIVGTGVPDGPYVKLTQYGEIVEKTINQLNDFYDHISIDDYVIMPNHIHLIVFINNKKKSGIGPSGTPVPTAQNSALSKFISTMKRFSNKECGESLWQLRSYDHVIRDQADYDKRVKYIYENPMRWHFDELYFEEK